MPGAVASSEEILRIEHLKKYFRIGGGFLQGNPLTIHAVDGVSLSIRKGETFGLVGESGCGKTTLGQTIVRLYEPTEGRIVFKGDDISHLSPAKMRPYRQHIQMIFQDPSASLDPRMTVSSIIAEPLNVAKIGTKQERKEQVQDLLRVVGLNSYFANRYPHEFSGGQRQRIGIARALAVNPELVVCDEPVSALDVSIQAQVLNLLRHLQEQFDLTYLFIAHNLAVVAHIADRIGVMYLGKVVEVGASQEVIERPKHPYTKALISAIPIPEPGRKRERILLHGDVPSPANPPRGCRFHPRCPIAQSKCSEDEPVLEEKYQNHWVACHYA
ncbi:MAG: ABC transporter ATP-binding protein [Thermomicrobiales bacterium]|nr:ABC transporter ATP-binding protein [Thermomicrobiales bacterium]